MGMPCVIVCFMAIIARVSSIQIIFDADYASYSVHHGGKTLFRGENMALFAEGTHIFSLLHERLP